MATIRMKKTRNGTTMRITAGKGEDLTDFVRALAGQHREPVAPADHDTAENADVDAPSKENP